MFDFVRSHTRLFQGILVLLIFPSFVFFGVQGYSGFTEGRAGTVAEVDGRPITQTEWDQAHQRNVERMRAQMPNVDIKLLDTPAMRQQTLDGLVRERVLLAAANGQHLLPADDRLQRLFRTDPQYAQLRNPDGSVNRDLLTAQGMTSEGFAQQLRMELGMRQVVEGLNASGLAPKTPFTTALDALLQRREVQLQRFETQAYLDKVSPAQADIDTYYKANEARFKLPEQAQIEYVVLDIEALKKGVSVSEADARGFYDSNLSRYTTAEERRASHILIKADKDMPAADKQKAKARVEALLSDVRRAPATFADVARKNSQDPGSAANGGDLDFFGRGAMVKAFEDAAFALKPGEISNVVESDFGYHVIKLEAVRGGDRKSFEAVRSEIEAEIGRQLAQRKFAESAEAFTNAVYEQSDSLNPAVEKFKLEKKTASVQRTPAPGAQGPLASPKLLEAVFSNEVLNEKRNTNAVDLGGSSLVAARVVQHTPARTQALADVLPMVKAAVQREQAAALARKEGEARLAQIRQAPETALPTALTVSRAKPEGLGGPLLDAVLQAPPDKLPAALGVDLGARGYAVVRVLKVLPRDPADAPEDQFSAQYAQTWSAAESAAYLEALKKRHKAQIKPAAAKAAEKADDKAAAPRS